MLLASTSKAFAKTVTTKKSYSTEQAAKASSSSHQEDMQIPLPPAAKHEEHAKKIPVPKSEELPHIHHFHKERVKKSNKHHKKYWALSQLILILCHIAILVIAYIHVTPH